GAEARLHHPDGQAPEGCGEREQVRPEIDHRRLEDPARGFPTERTADRLGEGALRRGRPGGHALSVEGERELAAELSYVRRRGGDAPPPLEVLEAPGDPRIGGAGELVAERGDLALERRRGGDGAP